MAENTKLTRPDAGQTSTVPVGPDARLEFTFDQGDANLSKDGQNLVFTFNDGATLTLEGFYNNFGDNTQPPTLIVEGNELPGEAFLAALNNPDLMPAAGPGAGATLSAGGSLEDALLAGVGGVDRLDKLAFDGWGRGTEVTEIYQSQGVLENAGGAAPAAPEPPVRFGFGDGFVVDESYLGSYVNEKLIGKAGIVGTMANAEDAADHLVQSGSFSLTANQLAQFSVNGSPIHAEGDYTITSPHGELAVSVTAETGGYTVAYTFTLTGNYDKHPDNAATMGGAYNPDPDQANPDSHWNEASRDYAGDDFLFKVGSVTEALHITIKDDGLAAGDSGDTVPYELVTPHYDLGLCFDLSSSMLVRLNGSGSGNPTTVAQYQQTPLFATVAGALAMLEEYKSQAGEDNVNISVACFAERAYSVSFSSYDNAYTYIANMLPGYVVKIGADGTPYAEKVSTVAAGTTWPAAGTTLAVDSTAHYGVATGTNYTAGLSALQAVAASLIGGDEQVRVYFMSDGEPNRGTLNPSGDTHYSPAWTNFLNTLSSDELALLKVYTVGLAGYNNDNAFKDVIFPLGAENAPPIVHIPKDAVPAEYIDNLVATVGINGHIDLPTTADGVINDKGVMKAFVESVELLGADHEVIGGGVLDGINVNYDTGLPSAKDGIIDTESISITLPYGAITFKADGSYVFQPDHSKVVNIPPTGESFTFKITFMDADGDTATREFTLKFDGKPATLTLTGSIDVEGDEAAYVFTAELSYPAQSEMIITSKDGLEIKIEAGETKGTLTVPAENPDDPYIDPSKLTFEIESIDGGGFTPVPVNNSATAHVNDTINETTASVASVVGHEDGSVTVTIALDNPVDPNKDIPATVKVTIGDETKTVPLDPGQSSVTVDFEGVLTTSVYDGATQNVVVGLSDFTGGNFEARAQTGGTFEVAKLPAAVTMSIKLVDVKEADDGTVPATITLSDAPTADGTITLTVAGGATVSVDLVAGQTVYDNIQIPHGNKEDVYLDPSDISVTASLTGGGYALPVAGASDGAHIGDTFDTTTVTLAGANITADGVVFTASVDHAPQGTDLVLTLSYGVEITIAAGATSGSSDPISPLLLGNGDVSILGTNWTGDQGIGGNYENLVVSEVPINLILNNPPTAVDDSNWIKEGGQYTVGGNVLKNDIDPDLPNDTLTVVSQSQVTDQYIGYGWLTLNTDGSYSFKLDEANPAVKALFASNTQGDEKLVAEYPYTMQDSHGETSSATLRIDIIPNKLIAGGSGADLLTGGLGDDILIGDPGGATPGYVETVAGKYNVNIIVDDSGSMKDGNRLTETRFALVRAVKDLEKYEDDTSGQQNVVLSFTKFGQSATTTSINLDGPQTDCFRIGDTLIGLATTRTTTTYYNSAGTTSYTSLPSSAGTYYSIDKDGNVIKIVKTASTITSTENVTSTANLGAIDADAYAFIAGLTGAGTSTNYEAAFLASETWFNGVKANGNENVVFFLTDGIPTSRYSTGTTVSTGNSAAQTSQAEFTEALEVYNRLISGTIAAKVSAIGVGSGINEDVLQYFDNTDTVGSKTTTFTRVNNNSDYEATFVYTGQAGQPTIALNAAALGGIFTGLIEQYVTGPSAHDVSNDIIYGSAGNDILFGDALNADFMLDPQWQHDNGWMNPNPDLLAGGSMAIITDFLTATLHGGTPGQVTIDELYNFVSTHHEQLGKSDTILDDHGNPRGANDTIYGGGGDDIIYGQGGNDTIYAGSGNNIVSGGDGDDIFAWKVADMDPFGTTTIKDFHHELGKVEGDVLRFDDLFASGQEALNDMLTLTNTQWDATSKTLTTEAFTLTIADQNNATLDVHYGVYSQHIELVSPTHDFGAVQTQDDALKLMQEIIKVTG